MATHMHPGQIRRRITEFLATKEMTQAQFLRQCGIVISGSGALAGFMKLKGKDKGYDNQVYRGALSFFQDRDARAKLEKNEKKRKAQDDGNDAAEAKRRKQQGEELIHSALQILLPTTAIFDDCDDVRSKGLAFLEDYAVTKTSFFRATGMNSNSWNTFLQTKGPERGRANEAYRKTYWFLEKLRIHRGDPKTAKRVKAEADLGVDGFSTALERTHGYYLQPRGNAIDPLGFRWP